ncbi:MAG: hypothetical protein GF384_08935 [Elusimicrobia bacterium]|nr:hypothetical protein [Elusimicrobiota bacterium]MBD3412720.1 hypothetical protein [Elusimicrobiota bacterium]
MIRILQFWYNAAVVVFFPLIMVGLALRYRARFFKHCFENFSQRMGKLPLNFAESITGNVIWLHAASVGELVMLKPLIHELKTRFLNHHLIISTITPEAYRMAVTSHLGEYVVYAPIDLVWPVRRAVRKIRPKLLLLAEAEFWPNLIIESAQTGTIIGVVNTRISDKAFRFMRLVRWWYRILLSQVTFFAARDEEDRQRVISFGIEKDRVVLTGNIKYDAVSVPRIAEHGLQQIYQRFSVPNNVPVIVFGSVHHAEIRMTRDSVKRLMDEFRSLHILIAPRHIEHVSLISRHLDSAGIPWRLFSTVNSTDHKDGSRIVIIDTIGDLVTAYRIAWVVFVGGSLMPKGGQNILEPALLEKPVLFGPHMHNFKSSARALIQCGGGVRVNNTQELETHCRRFLTNPQDRYSSGQRAQVAASGLRGATGKTIQLIREWYNPDRYLYEKI